MALHFFAASQCESSALAILQFPIMKTGRYQRTGHTKNGCSLLSKMVGPYPRIMNMARVGANATDVEVNNSRVEWFP